MPVRRAEKADAKMLAAEFWYPLAQMMEKYSEANKLKDNARKIAEDGFLELIEDESYEVFFFVEGSEEIACLNLKIEDSPTRVKEDYVDIVDLFVKEGYRGKGVGTDLIDKAESWAAERDFDYLTVSAEWDNKDARGFYEKKGFDRKQLKYIRMID